MLSAVIVTIIIIAFVQVAMRAPKLVPSGLQNFAEWMLEMMIAQLDNLLGHETTIRGFWYFGGLFVFIFLSNLFACSPASAASAGATTSTTTSRSRSPSCAASTPMTTSPPPTRRFSFSCSSTGSSARSGSSAS
ncbi:MAG: F0F1 ATP synthase subunit A [Verrucomicrobiota bacterium]